MNELTTRPHSQETRKTLGAFYTPEELSSVLADWAVVSPTAKVLEPSFGGCGFLLSTRKRLATLGALSPDTQIYGCDIDSQAFGILTKVFGSSYSSENFVLRDFLDLRNGIDFPFQFDSIVGNPPYVPYQSLTASKRNEYSARWISSGTTISKKASLWAHFLVQATEFLAPSGRMAWILPGAFLQADYAIAVREHLQKSFERLLCVQVRQRFFKTEGTEEETVVLLAAGRTDGASESKVEFTRVEDVRGLKKTVTSWESGKLSTVELTSRPSYLSTSDSLLREFERIANLPASRKLGDVLRSQIGLVTGANRFFVLSEEERMRWNLSETNPVLSRLNGASGLRYAYSDHIKYLLSGGRGHLVHSNSVPSDGSPLANYLATFPQDEISKVLTFKKRRSWYAPDDRNIPDAFLSSMSHDGPRLVLNEAGVNCTNSIHRAYFLSGIDKHQQLLVAISLQTTFSQLSAEFVGRKYGSGVLKHEPRDIEKVSVYLPRDISNQEIESAFRTLDGLLRKGHVATASLFADNFVFRSVSGAEDLLSSFRTVLTEERSQRRDLVLGVLG